MYHVFSLIATAHRAFVERRTIIEGGEPLLASVSFFLSTNLISKLISKIDEQAAAHRAFVKHRAIVEANERAAEHRAIVELSSR